MSGTVIVNNVLATGYQSQHSFSTLVKVKFYDEDGDSYHEDSIQLLPENDDTADTLAMRALDELGLDLDDQTEEYTEHDSEAFWMRNLFKKTTSFYMETLGKDGVKLGSNMNVLRAGIKKLNVLVTEDCTIVETGSRVDYERVFLAVIALVVIIVVAIIAF
jgi:hypothetical protein